MEKEGKEGRKREKNRLALRWSGRVGVFIGWVNFASCLQCFARKMRSDESKVPDM